MALDVVLPIAAYYVLHSLFGVDDVLALTVGGLLSGVRVLYTVLRDRKVDGFALFVMALFAVGLALAFVTGDARFVLAKESFGSGVAGLIILGTCLLGSPFTYHATRRFVAGGDAAKLESMRLLYATSTVYRAIHMRLSLVWGVGLLLEAALRVVLIYQLPVAAMVAISPVLQIVAIGGLLVLSMRSGRRAALMVRADATGPAPAQRLV